MAKWQVRVYELLTNGTRHGGDMTSQLLSGTVNIVLNDTSTFDFSLPASAIQSGWDFAPLKTYVMVDSIERSNQFYPTVPIYRGFVVNRTYDIVNGVYTFSCVGALGMYKFLPPFRAFGANSSMIDVLAICADRFTNNAVYPYAVDNPWLRLYSAHSDIMGYFGHLTTFFIGTPYFNDEFMNIQANAENACEFVKQICSPDVYTIDFDPMGYSDICFADGGERINIRMYDDRDFNLQQIKYNRNLISCEITDEPYVTSVKVFGGAQEITASGADFPNIFYLKDYHLPTKTVPYTYDECDNYGKMQLGAQTRVVEATGFDEGILDNGQDFFSILAPVLMTYLENGEEKQISARITSIVYNLTSPQNSSVSLGKKIIPLTQRR